MPLTDAQREFLQKHLGVGRKHTKKGGLFGLGKSVNDEIRVAYEAYRGQFEAADSAIAKLKKLKGTDKQVKEFEDELNGMALESSDAERPIDEARGSFKKASRNCQSLAGKADRACSIWEADKNSYEKLRPVVETTIKKVKTVPLADSAPLDDLLKTADAEADEGHYTAALGELKKGKQVRSDILKKAKAAQKLELSRITEKPHYENKLKKLQETRDYLKSLAETEVQKELLKKAIAAITAGEAIAKSGDYVGAYKAIVALVPATSKLRKQGEKANKTPQKKALKDKVVAAAYSKVQTAISRLEKVAMPDDVVVHHDSLNRMLVAFSNTLKTSPETARLLQQLTDEVDGIAGGLEGHKSGARDDAAQVQKRLDQILGIAETEDLAPLQRRLHDASTLITTRQYTQALSELAEIDRDAEVLEKSCSGTRSELKESWNQKAAERKTLVKSVELLKSSGWELAEKKTLELKLMLSDAERRATEGRFDLALEMFEQVSLKIGSWIDRLSDYRVLEADRNKARKAVGGKLTEAEKALKTLQKAFKAAGGDGDGLRQHVDCLAALKHNWEDRLGSASTARELDAEGAAREFSELTETLTGLAADSKQLEGVVADEKKAGLQKEHSQALSEVRKALEGLRGIDLTNYRKLLAESDSIASGEDLQAAIDALGKLKERVEDTKNETNTRREEALKLVQKELKLVKDAAKAAAGLIKRSASSFFKTYFEGLKEEFLDLEGMSKSTSIMTLEDTATALRELKQRVASLGKMMDESETGEQGSTKGVSVKTLRENFRAVTDKLSDIKDLLNDSNLKTCMENRKLKLDNAFKEKQEEAGKLPPKEALKVLAEFEETVSAALAKAEEAASKRTSNKMMLKEQEGLLKKVDKKKGKELVADFKARIKAARKQSTTEGQEDQAKAAIDELILELRLVRGSDEELLDAETRLKMKKFETEKAKKAWQARLKTFKKVELAQAEKAVSEHKEGDKTQIKDLKRLVNQAQELASAEDYKGANGTLDDTLEHARQVIGSPQGLKASSRGKLPRCNANWKAAVVKFNASADTLSKAVRDAARDETADDIKKAVNVSVSELGHLKRMFNVTAYGATLTILESSKEPVQKRRKAREDALRLVRRHNSDLTEDPLLLKLQSKPRPFGLMDQNAVYAALKDLDLNVQRCV